MGHACCKSSNREHLFALDHHLLQAHLIGDVVHPDDSPFHTVIHQGKNGDILVTGFDPRFARNLRGCDHPALAHGRFDLRHLSGQAGKHLCQGLGPNLLQAQSGGLLRLTVPLGHPAVTVYPNTSCFGVLEIFSMAVLKI